MHEGGAALHTRVFCACNAYPPPRLCLWLICHVHARVAGAQAGSHVVIGRLFLHDHLDAVGQEAKDGTDPQQDGEASEQLTAELDPLRGGGGGSQRVLTVSGQNLCSSGVAQALKGKLFF